MSINLGGKIESNLSYILPYQLTIWVHMLIRRYRISYLIQRVKC